MVITGSTEKGGSPAEQHPLGNPIVSRVVAANIQITVAIQIQQVVGRSAVGGNPDHVNLAMDTVLLNLLIGRLDNGDLRLQHFAALNLGREWQRLGRGIPRVLGKQRVLRETETVRVKTSSY